MITKISREQRKKVAEKSGGGRSGKQEWEERKRDNGKSGSRERGWMDGGKKGGGGD